MVDRGQQARLQSTATQRDAAAVTMQIEEEEEGEKGKKRLDTEAKSLCGGEADGWSLGH